MHHPHFHRRKKMASVSDNWSIDFLITVFAQRNGNVIVSILSSMCLYLFRLRWSETCSIYQSVNAWHNIDETISHPENVLKSVSTLNFDGYWLYESSVQFLTALMNISFGFLFLWHFFLLFHTSRSLIVPSISEYSCRSEHTTQTIELSALFNIKRFFSHYPIEARRLAKLQHLEICVCLCYVYAFAYPFSLNTRYC